MFSVKIRKKIFLLWFLLLFYEGMFKDKMTLLVNHINNNHVNQEQDFVEEVNLGLNLSSLPAFIDDKNKYVYCISDNCIIVFNARSGKRSHILKHHEKHLFVYANERYCVSITETGNLLSWDIELHACVKVEKISKIPLSFVYKATDGFYCVASLSGSTQIFKLVLQGEGNVQSYSKLGGIQKLVKSRKHLTISDQFAVIISKPLHLEVISFKGKLKLNQYICRSSFPNLEKPSHLAFDYVLLVDDTLYASLNIGRVVIFKAFSHDGFKTSNMAHFHRHPSAIEYVVTNRGILYAGSGEATVTRWNLNATGNGRWQRPDNSEKFNAPVSCLSLSKDETLLIVQLEDNTVWVVQTSSMNILCECQTMQWNNNNNWLPLCRDPLKPDLILTGGRIGHIQWFEPTKWKTIASFDITEENTPPRDNIPYDLYYDWLNVYLLNASPSTLVTVERRRNRENEPSWIKFFRRNPKSLLCDLSREDTIEWPNLGFKLMSSNDDLNVDESFAALKEEEIVFIDCIGQITIFMRDVNRTGRWFQDLSRTNHWMGSKIISATSVRSSCFGAIHTIGQSTSSYILIWKLEDLSIYQMVDTIVEPTVVEWAPIKKQGSENVLIIGSKECVSAFDVVGNCVLWVIKVSKVSIFASLDVVCCYRKSNAFIIDPLTGIPEKEVVFGTQTKELFVATPGKNLRFVALNKKQLSVLKIEASENEPQNEMTNGFKKTPFAEMIIQNREQEGYLEQIRTFKNMSLKSRFDGPVYSLAPLTRIGPELIKECFIPRESDF